MKNRELINMIDKWKEEDEEYDDEEEEECESTSVHSSVGEIKRFHVGNITISVRENSVVVNRTTETFGEDIESQREARSVWDFMRYHARSLVEDYSMSLVAVDRETTIGQVVSSSITRCYILLTNANNKSAVVATISYRPSTGGMVCDMMGDMMGGEVWKKSATLEALEIDPTRVRAWQLVLNALNEFENRVIVER